LIAGFFDPNYPQPLPMITVALFLPRITRDWVGVDFLLDTGADTTSLFPQDALTLVGIDWATVNNTVGWPSPKPMRGVAGSGERYPWPVTYAFQHQDGRWQSIDGQIDIVRPSPDTMSVESLLGWDVLRHFRVIVDWSQRQVSLEQSPALAP
jgi:hypothetical protein